MNVIKNFFISSFGFYSEWMLWVVGLIFFFIILIIFFITRERDDYKKFKTFVKYDVVWKWKYRGKQIVGLWCYCPECENSLICDDEHSRIAALGEKNTFFICSKCGGNEKGRAIGGDRGFVLKLIKNEIYRLIKTEQYKEKYNLHASSKNKK